MDSFVDTVPFLNEPDACRRLFAEFCWDFLYPDIDTFFIALSENRPPAVARLVQCRGLFESACVLGETVWKRYEKYRVHIHPARRKECDHLCELHKSPIFS